MKTKSKKISKKIITLLLTFTFVMSLSINAFAASNSTYIHDTSVTYHNVTLERTSLTISSTSIYGFSYLSYQYNINATFYARNMVTGEFKAIVVSKNYHVNPGKESVKFTLTCDDFDTTIWDCIYFVNETNVNITTVDINLGIATGNVSVNIN